MCHKVSSLPVGTILQSPSGIIVWVSAVHRAYPYTLYLTIEHAYIVPATGASYSTITDELIEAGAGMSSGPLLADEALILYNDELYRQFMWPAVHLGWKIEHTPGLNPRQPDINQSVPSMLYLNVSSKATDN